MKKLERIKKLLEGDYYDYDGNYYEFDMTLDDLNFYFDVKWRIKYKNEKINYKDIEILKVFMDSKYSKREEVKKFLSNEDLDIIKEFIYDSYIYGNEDSIEVHKEYETKVDEFIMLDVKIRVYCYREPAQRGDYWTPSFDESFNVDTVTWNGIDVTDLVKKGSRMDDIEEEAKKWGESIYYPDPDD
jgi:hypothetical protein